VFVRASTSERLPVADAELSREPIELLFWAQRAATFSPFWLLFLAQKRPANKLTTGNT